MALDKTLLEDVEIPTMAKLCALSLDGVLIPTRYTRNIPADSRWAEAACGTVSFFDHEGELISTRYLARMPEHKKKTLKQQLEIQINHIIQRQKTEDM